MEQLPHVVWPLTSATLAIAAIATAIVELFKDLLPIRRGFRRRFLASWFSKRLSARKAIGQQQLLEAETELIRLGTGGDRIAFYDLEPAQLCGQINSAAQMALAYPDRHPALLRFLAPEADEKDVDLVAKSTDPAARRDATASPQQQTE